MREKFFTLLKEEVQAIDNLGLSKREEKVIEGYVINPNQSPRAIINGSEYILFNANDYLGLRFNPKLAEAEEEALKAFGAGPGAVRFIAGTTRPHVALEHALARMHARDAAMVFSSAFATNLAVIQSLVRGQRKDSILKDSVLIVSDELNHRSIIDAIRLANVSSEQKKIYKHLQYEELRALLKEHAGKYDRTLVISDGVFSMLGEIADLKALRSIADEFNSAYSQGVLLIIDDSHGVGAAGNTGRGAEEVHASQADVLIATLGKALGTDGGYVVAKKEIIDYLKEAAATYIYSNPIPPATAAAALAAVELLDSEDGHEYIQRLKENIAYFKEQAESKHIPFAAPSEHPIQPVLIGDPKRNKQIALELFKRGYVVTPISYPVVPAGKDELRVQLNSLHTKSEIEAFIATLGELLQEIR